MLVKRISKIIDSFPQVYLTAHASKQEWDYLLVRRKVNIGDIVRTGTEF